MVDIVSKKKRSEMMSRIRARDTKPELFVRKLIYSLGYRYRLHCKDLPGKPDIVFKGKRKAIFVHGCFWHQHEHCPRASIPKTRVDFWMKKLANNVKRDTEVIRRLHQLGWETLIIWECETDSTKLKEKITKFLGNNTRH